MCRNRRRQQTKLTSLAVNSYSGDNNGYPIAATNLISAMFKHIDIWAGSENVLNFCKPEDFVYGKYTIGYVPWESTKFPDHWADSLKRCDDIWTTASWLVPYFQEATGREDIWVLPHGVAPHWTPLEHHRSSRRPFRFLHVGSDTPRKGADIVLKVWDQFGFKDDPSLELIIKCQSGGVFARVRDEDGNVTKSPKDFNNVKVVNEDYSQAEMWRLYALSDCMVYPSRGEGFGLIPLEAMSSGLPCIYTGQHSGDYTDLGVTIPGELQRVPEQFQDIHPGDWLEPDIHELVRAMNWMVYGYEHYADQAMVISSEIQERFNWAEIGYQAAQRILERT